MQILCLHTLVLSVGYHVGDVYKAIGRPDILIKLGIPVFIIRVIAIWVGAQQGLVGVALGHLAATSIELIMRTVITIKVVKVSLPELLKQMTAFIGGGALLACTIPMLLVTTAMGPLPRLIVIILAGAIGYISVMWMIERESLTKAMRTIGVKL
jgi:PST family polysaccharide transporter